MVTEVVAVTEVAASMAVVTEAAFMAVDFAEAGGVEPELALLV
jgi:hypothetical protein